MIQFVKVSKSFGTHSVLKDLDLLIPAGSLTVILGPSGTGKSVLLKHILGLIEPNSGKILVDGVDLTTLYSDEVAFNDFRKRFGMLFQNAALFDSMNVYENVAFPLREHTALSEEEIKKKVLGNLQLVGLEKAFEKMPSELSGGMRKRVGLARAIALEPQIILYDEPTTGLDPLMTEAINELIVRVHQHPSSQMKVTTLIISHDIESTFRMADFIAFLYEGKIVAQGSPEEMVKSQHPFVREFLKKPEDRLRR